MATERPHAQSDLFLLCLNFVFFFFYACIALNFDAIILHVPLMRSSISFFKPCVASSPLLGIIFGFIFGSTEVCHTAFHVPRITTLYSSHQHITRWLWHHQIHQIRRRHSSGPLKRQSQPFGPASFDFER